MQGEPSDCDVGLIPVRVREERGRRMGKERSQTAVLYRKCPHQAEGEPRSKDYPKSNPILSRNAPALVTPMCSAFGWKHPKGEHGFYVNAVAYPIGAAAGGVS